MQAFDTVDSANRARHIVPCFSSLHQALLEPFLGTLGYRLLPLRHVEDTSYDVCLSLTNNEICYSSAHLLGQMVEVAAEDPSLFEGADVILPTPCLDCRCDEAPRLLERILMSRGQDSCRVVSLREHVEAGQLGAWPWTRENCLRLAQMLCLADLIIQGSLKTRSSVSADTLRTLTGHCVQVVQDRYCRSVRNALVAARGNDVDAGRPCDGMYFSAASQIIEAFTQPLSSSKGTPARIGVVGTYPLLYCDAINNGLFKQIVGEGCEPELPCSTELFEHFLESTAGMAPAFLEALKASRKALHGFMQERYPLWPCLGLWEDDSLEGFRPRELPRHLVCGAGWRMSASVARMIASGIKDILYVRSFACLPGHTLGQGAMKIARTHNKGVNIVSVEYDLGTSRVNQDNRIKLLTTLAKDIAGASPASLQ